MQHWAPTRIGCPSPQPRRLPDPVLGVLPGNVGKNMRALYDAIDKAGIN